MQRTQALALYPAGLARLAHFGMLPSAGAAWSLLDGLLGSSVHAMTCPMTFQLLSWLWAHSIAAKIPGRVALESRGHASDQQAHNQPGGFQAQ